MSGEYRDLAHLLGVNLTPRPVDLGSDQDSISAQLSKNSYAPSGLGSKYLTAPTQDQQLNAIFDWNKANHQPITSRKELDHLLFQNSLSGFGDAGPAGPTSLDEYLKQASQGSTSQSYKSALQKGYENYLSSWDDSLKELQSSPVAQVNRGGGNDALLRKELESFTSTVPGYSLANRSGNTAQHIERLVPNLSRFGVQSFFDLKPVQVPDPSGNGTKTLFYDERNKQFIPGDFGSSMAGKGGSYYNLVNAGPLSLPTASWTNTSDGPSIAKALGIASLVLGPAAIGGISSLTGLGTAGSGALFGAGMGGLQAGLTGGNALKGALVGGATGWLGGRIGGKAGQLNLASKLGVDNATAQALLNSAVKSGGSAALRSAVTGGDIGNSLLAGAVSGGLSGGLTQALGGGSLASFGGGALGKYAAQALQGRDTSRASTALAKMGQTSQQGGFQMPMARSSPGGSVTEGRDNYFSLDATKRGRVDSAIDRLWGDLAPAYKLRYS